MTNNTTAVIGGTGKTGRRVVERLRARGADVRSLSRPRFDWEDRATWGPALDGASAAYVTYYPDLTVPGAVDAVAELTEIATARGVERIVLLSGRGEDEAQRAERAVQAAAKEWTIVRCSWFNQNFSEGDFRDLVLGGELALPVGDIPEPFVDADDIADVAAAALTGNGHGGEVYELTGPRALTFAQVAEELGRASGRPVRFVPLTLEQYRAGMEDIGVPADVISLTAFLFSEVLDGRNAQPTDGVERALGRAPRDFAQFAARAAAQGAWS